MLDLSESRAQIDVIDKEITRLFQKRIDVCRDVAAYKIQNNKKVLDKTRENQKLEALSKLAEDGFKEHGICDLFTQVMAICRKRQYQSIQSCCFHGIFWRLGNIFSCAKLRGGHEGSCK